MKTLLAVAPDHEIDMTHREIAEALSELVTQKDPIFRRAALQRLHALSAECQLLGKGSLEFTSTESWRVVYEELLRSPGLHLYRSVAYVQSSSYWQDAPGQQSTKLNLELHDAGVVSIERIAIIADHLWPEGALFPSEPIRTWLDQQHRHGIWLKLARESELSEEPHLLADFGIYGSRAVGRQKTDLAGRTVAFVLTFDFDAVQQAEEHWSQLSVFSVPFRELLDRQH